MTHARLGVGAKGTSPRLSPTAPKKVLGLEVNPLQMQSARTIRM